MSDLFGPMPLPDRPVKQFADIAEREAIAKQKEIDTRMRERLETGRLQSIHDIGVAKEEYRTSLQKLEQNFRKEAMQARSSKSYASGSASRSKQVFASSTRGTKDLERMDLARETNRLTVQYYSGKVSMGQLERLAPKIGMERGYNPSQFAEYIQEELLKLTSNDRYNREDPFYSSITTKHEGWRIRDMHSFLLNVTEDFSDRWTNKNVESNFNNNLDNAKELLNDFGKAEDDTLSWDTNVHELPAWIALEEMVSDPGVRDMWSTQAIQAGDLLKGKGLQPHVQRNLVDVVGRMVAVEATTALTSSRGDTAQQWAHLSLQQHTDMAIANAYASPFVQSMEEYFKDDAQLQKMIRDDVFGKMEEAIKKQDLHDMGLQRQMAIDDMMGLNNGMDPLTRLSLSLDNGVPWEKALKESQEWGVWQLEQSLEQTAAIAADLEANRDAEHAAFVSSTRTAMKNHPELFPNTEETRLAFLRMEGPTGPLRPGDGEALFNKHIEGMEKDLLDMYPGLNEQVDSFVDQVNADENTKDNQGMPVFLDKERGMTADQFGEDTVEWYENLILNPQDGKRPTPESVQELLDRRLNVFVNRLDLKKKTQRNLGVLTRSTGGEAQGTGMAFRIVPLAGAREVHSDRLLTQLDVSEEVRDEFESLPLEERGRFAVRQIKFDRGFTGTETDDEVETEVRSRLAHLQQAGGPVRRYSVDRASRTAYVQLVHNGETHAILLDDADTGKKLADLGNLMIEARVTLEETSQALLAHGASLFYVHTDPSTGEVSEHKTALVDVLMQKGERALNAVLQFVRSSGISGSRNFWGAR